MVFLIIWIYIFKFWEVLSFYFFIHFFLSIYLFVFLGLLLNEHWHCTTVLHISILLSNMYQGWDDQQLPHPIAIISPYSVPWEPQIPYCRHSLPDLPAILAVATHRLMRECSRLSSLLTFLVSSIMFPCCLPC